MDEESYEKRIADMHINDLVNAEIIVGIKHKDPHNNSIRKYEKCVFFYKKGKPGFRVLNVAGNPEYKFIPSTDSYMIDYPKK